MISIWCSAFAWITCVQFCECLKIFSTTSQPHFNKCCCHRNYRLISWCYRIQIICSFGSKQRKIVNKISLTSVNNKNRRNDSDGEELHVAYGICKQCDDVEMRWLDTTPATPYRNCLECCSVRRARDEWRRRRAAEENKQIKPFKMLGKITKYAKLATVSPTTWYWRQK